MTNDLTAIRAQMEALTGFTAGPWRDEDGVIQSQTTVWQNGVKQVGWDYAAILADVTDDWDQAANARLIAAAPDMHATIFALCDALDELRAENERLQTIIDNLHAVEENHRETANADFHRVNRLQIEKWRLTKERDEARAQVAAAYGSAADALQNVADNWDCGHNESRLCDCARDVEQWGFAADEARSMTPADAKAALEAYGREKVREGMQRAAEVARECWNDPPCEADAEYIPNAILADMEKLK